MCLEFFFMLFLFSLGISHYMLSICCICLYWFCGCGFCVWVYHWFETRCLCFLLKRFVIRCVSLPTYVRVAYCFWVWSDSISLFLICFYISVRSFPTVFLLRPYRNVYNYVSLMYVVTFCVVLDRLRLRLSLCQFVSAFGNLCKIRFYYWHPTNKSTQLDADDAKSQNASDEKQILHARYKHFLQYTINKKRIIRKFHNLHTICILFNLLLVCILHYL